MNGDAVEGWRNTWDVLGIRIFGIFPIQPVDVCRDLLLVEIYDDFHQRIKGQKDQTVNLKNQNRRKIIVTAAMRDHNTSACWKHSCAARGKTPFDLSHGSFQCLAFWGQETRCCRRNYHMGTLRARSNLIAILLQLQMLWFWGSASSYI